VHPAYYVAEHARRHVTVALTGDGGDEAFAGTRSTGTISRLAAQACDPDGILNMLLRRSTALIDDGGDSRRASAARFVATSIPIRW
jgi:asparagine synthetase B (glutamine-hydrolysing)